MADLDDLDEFLYGDDDSKPSSLISPPQAAAIPLASTTTAADTEDHVFVDIDQDDDEDDDDDDDDIDIVLDATIQTPDPVDQAKESLVTLKPGEHRSSSNNADGQSSANAATVPSASKTSLANINFDTVDQLALYDDKPITEIAIESFDDKPWRRPGEDISDYFNFGFNEDTWKMYCDRQRHLREEQTQLFRRRFAPNHASHPSLPPMPRANLIHHHTQPNQFTMPLVVPHANLGPPPVIPSLPSNVNLPPGMRLRNVPAQEQFAAPPSMPAMPPSMPAMPPSMPAMPPSMPAMPPSMPAMPPSMPAMPPSMSAIPPAIPPMSAKSAAQPTPMAIPPPKPPVIQQQPISGGGLASRLKLRGLPTSAVMAVPKASSDPVQPVPTFNQPAPNVLPAPKPELLSHPVPIKVDPVPQASNPDPPGVKRDFSPAPADRTLLAVSSGDRTSSAVSSSDRTRRPADRPARDQLPSASSTRSEWRSRHAMESRSRSRSPRSSSRRGDRSSRSDRSRERSSRR